VVFCGTREEAIAKLEALAPETKHMPVIGAIRVAGDNMQCHAGDYGKATATGNRGTATAGYRGDATAGDYGKAIAGDGGTAIAGAKGTAIAGDGGTAIADDDGTAIAGDGGTATAGYRGTATAGDRGKASAGDYGKAIAGDRGKATAGARGRIFINWWDEKVERMRTTTGYVGEDGIQANISYKCDKEGNLIVVSEGETLNKEPINEKS
jgi:hypothetical protein